jgi:hypothetical protein
VASRPSVQSHAADIRSVGGAQGWNIDQLAGLTGRSLVQLLRQHGTRSGPGTVCLGTLLGPEGTGGSPLRTSDSRSRPSRAGPTGHGTAPFVERPAVVSAHCARRLRYATRPGLDSHPYLENCTVDASIKILCGQVNKGARWMPWHQEPMKDVGGCDKPRGAANRAVIRGFPNGETRQESCPVTLT